VTDIRPAEYFDLKNLFQIEVIQFESRKGQEYVVHDNGERLLLADELHRAVEICRVQGNLLRHRLLTLNKVAVTEDARRIRLDIQMILRNQATIFVFYHFMTKHSPCDLNVFRGMQEIVEEFPYVEDKKYPLYFLPEELPNPLLCVPDEGVAVVMPDGSKSITYGVISSKRMYRSTVDYLEDLQSDQAQVQGPAYIIRSPYQMMMTLLKKVCENMLIMRKCRCCGRLFQARHAGKKYCSKECSEKRQKEQTKSSKEKEDVKALRNFRQAVLKRFSRYCQGRTKDFSLGSLKIPEEYDALITDFKRAVTLRDQAKFYNALDDLIQNQKEKLQPDEYLYWLEHAGRKRKVHGNR
jgi:hypothetical protein